MAHRTAVCTIVSKNYLHFARTLMRSLAEAEPAWDRWVLLVDRLEEAFDPAAEPFELLEVEELPIREKTRMLFHYNILELNTAVKPWLLDWLFHRKGYSRVVYLDPDIFVYSPLADVSRAWDDGALAVLTPHLTGRLRDDRRPSELDILRAGTYNLGFIALAKHRSLRGLLDYWQEKSLSEFASDPDQGLFTDQKWIDLVPGFFDDVRVLRNEGFNVAYWNLAHRRLRRTKRGWKANDDRLVFFHFSGLDPASPEPFSKHQNRFRLESIGEVRDLVLGYCRTVLANGYDVCRGWKYAFGRFDDGTPIPECLRVFYRVDPAARRVVGEDPFAAGPAPWNLRWAEGEDGPPITWAMRAVWEIRRDLRQAFPDLAGAHRLEYFRWFAGHGAREQGMPEVFLDPVREAVSSQPAWKIESAIPLVPSEALRPLPPPPAVPRSGILDLFSGWRPSGPSAISAVERERVAEGLTTGFHVQSPSDRAAGLAWMGARALIPLVGAAGKSGFVRGFHRASFFERAKVGRKLRLQAEIDGVPAGEATLREGGPFALEFHVPESAGERAVLRIVASRWFVPAEAGINEDPRPLSVQISSVEVDGRSVVDFAPPPPRPPAPIGTRRLVPDLFGFYEQDGHDRSSGFAWMGPRGRLRTGPLGAGSTLAIVGEYHPDWMRLAHGSAALSIEVDLDGHLVVGAELESGGPFRVEAIVPAIENRDSHLLTLSVDRTFVLAKLGVSADIRALSVRIARVELNGQPLLDFSRSGSPSARVGEPVASSAPPFGINVIGYARAETGVGQSARGAAASCEAAGIPCHLYDFRDGLGEGAETPLSNPLFLAGPEHFVNFFHVNADQMPVVAPLLGDPVFRGRYNVACWHWELPELPDEWLGSFDALDEIWAPSRFVLEAIAAKSPIPVVHLPHGVEVPVTPGIGRGAFGLPEGKFLFLMMYDTQSFQERKNPEAVLDAWARAFPKGRSDVGLVIKTMNPEANPEGFARLRERVERLPGVILIAERFDRQKVYDLEAVVDCYVQLHRSEGWGMNLIESMYLGKPVIGTCWSGNADFMNPSNSCAVGYRLVELERDFGPYRRGQLWADPDVEQAAGFMRRLVEDEAWRRTIASLGQESVRRDFSFRAAGERYRRRLEIVRRLI
jgi:glycosyltransferase involved in cell wall biosynthesis